VAKSIGKDNLARGWGRESKVVKKIIRRDFWNPQTQCFNFGKPSDGTYRAEKTTLPALGIYFGAASEEQTDQCVSSYASIDFSADGSVWPLFTGWASLAEFFGGKPVEAFQHLCSNVGLFTHFGAGYMEEVLHGERFQPAGVCPHQAWSETMVLQPALEGMLGLKSDSLSKRLTLRPYLPLGTTIRQISVGSRKSNKKKLIKEYSDVPANSIGRWC
jgi:hypothetical protein